MGASASLERVELSVEPGQQTSTQLRIRNNGAVVDLFTFEGLGAAATWIDVQPESVSLFPGAEETVTVNFRPPRSSSVAPGPTPFGIKVVSQEDPAGSAAEEGVITVGQFADRTVELFPLTARGRRRGRFELAVDNRGNAPIQVDLAGSDGEGVCDYKFASDSVVVEPGTAKFTKLRVEPRKKFWKGPPKTHQFQVLVTERPLIAEPEPDPAGGWAPPGADPGTTGGATAVALAPSPAPPVAPPETVNGTLLQEALLPPWIVKAVLLAIALLLLLWLLWQLLLKPTVESAAEDAVAEELDVLEERVDEVAPTTVAGQQATVPATQPGGEDGGDEAGGEDGGEDGGGEDGDGSTTTTTASGGPATTVPEFATTFGDPTDFQLGIGTAVPAGTSQPFSQPFSAQFALTDIVLQNPGGDIGRVEISRDGAVVFASALENFRDYDLHFVAPYIFGGGQNLTMTVQCTTPGPSNSGCSVSASFAGFSK